MANNNNNDGEKSDLIDIVGLNTHGLKSNVPFISELISHNDLIFISEHWLSNAEKPLIKDILSKNQKLHFTPAEKKATGRPHGGICFVVNKERLGVTTVVHEDEHILAIRCSINNKSYIFMGLYLTCYHGNSTINEYQQELDILTGLLQLYGDECQIVMIGDLQTFPTEIYDHLPRNNSKRNPLSPLLQGFLLQNELELCDVTNGIGPTISYQHKTLPQSSYIDHIVILQNRSISYTNCQVHDPVPLNMSDHQPISLSICCEHTSMSQIMEEEASNVSVPSFAWQNTDFVQEYSDKIEHDLTQLSDTGQAVDIDMMCTILHESSRYAFNICFPDRELSPYARSWWTPELSHLKMSLTTHFNNWKEQNFPRDNDNVLFNRFVLARKMFRKAVKHAQNKKIYDSLHKMNSLRNTHPQKFWTKIRQLRKNNTKRLFEVNGKHSNEEITEEFADNFNSLLNNPVIPCETAPREIPPPETSPNRIHISVEDLKKCIKQLKEHKAMDPSYMVSEHIIYAFSDSLETWLVQFYNGIFDNQDTPENLSKSTIHPLVKSFKKSLKSFNNYRGISIIPVFTKLLEYIILHVCPEIAESHPLQHGYKLRSSTLHAEFLIRETIHHYNKNGSAVYVCGLDAEKAFDSCNWGILFEKLYYRKNIPLSIVNVIKSLYANSSARVKYGNKYSYEFMLSQGVRQGSVLSPHCYNEYTDDLLRKIENFSEYGTTLHGQYTGILMYADDIILMSPTISGLRKLIEQVTKISQENCINFNADKTEFCVSKSNSGFEDFFVMNGYTIKPSCSLKHLGVLWNLKNNILTMDDENIKLRISKFWSVIHTLIKEGIRFCHPHTVKHLYNTLAVPTLTYGIELCDLTPQLVNKLDLEGRKAIKSLFNLSIYSKNYLNTLLNIEHISTKIMRNKFNLFTRLLDGINTATPIMNMLESNNTGSFLTDLRRLAALHNIDIVQVIVSRELPPIESDYPEIPEDTYNTLLNSVNNWTDANSRRNFIQIMEERVAR